MDVPTPMLMIRTYRLFKNGNCGAPTTPAPTLGAAAYTTDSGTCNGLTGFVAFNWAHAGADYPDGTDPLGETLGGGGCVVGSKDLPWRGAPLLADTPCFR